jgi:oligoribonuclease
MPDAPSSKDLLVWLDMEMTGLDPVACVPLQVAIVVTSPELVELDSMELALWQPESRLETMEPYVRKMHTDNGLLAKVRASDVSLLDAEKRMISVLTKWCRPGEGVLAGNSIHQDRRFLERYFPVFSGLLHYRMVDVSTMKELVRRWYGQDALFAKASSLHTALADARESIEELKHFRGSVMRPK